MKRRPLTFIIILISLLTLCVSIYAFILGYRDGKALKQKQQTKEVAR